MPGGARRRLRHGVALLAAATLAAATVRAPARADLPRSWLAEATSAPLPALRRGVVVLGVGAAPAEATWPVALAVYGDAALRPRLDDRDARALAGAAVEADAPTSTTDLAALRTRSTADDDVASRALLAEVARRTGARAVVLVSPPSAAENAVASARLWDAADDRLDATLFRAPWTTLVDALRARYAASPTTGSASASASATATPAPAPHPTDERGTASEGSGTFSSVWFWGALGGAVLVGALVYVATRDQGQGAPAPVRIEWGK